MLGYHWQPEGPEYLRAPVTVFKDLTRTTVRRSKKTKLTSVNSKHLNATMFALELSMYGCINEVFN